MSRLLHCWVLPLTVLLHAAFLKQKAINTLWRSCGPSGFVVAYSDHLLMRRHLPLFTACTLLFRAGACAARRPASAAAASINLLLKAESMQKTGSFKIRGATNAVRAMIESGEVTALPEGAGVVTHSSGNHGQALAAAAAASNVKCVVVVPEGSPAVKANAARDYGAEVVYCAPNLASRESVCAQMQAVTGATFVPPYNHKLIMAGQGTLGIDIMQQAPQADVVVVPISGGGLISGAGYTQIEPCFSSI